MLVGEGKGKEAPGGKAGFGAGRLVVVVGERPQAGPGQGDSRSGG